MPLASLWTPGGRRDALCCLGCLSEPPTPPLPFQPPSIPPPLQPLNPPLQANNGVCDDGRAEGTLSKLPNDAKYSFVHCDLGTDCADCGPWQPTRTPPWCVCVCVCVCVCIGRAGRSVSTRLSPLPTSTPSSTIPSSSLSLHLPGL